MEDISSSSTSLIVPRHIGIIMDGNRRWAKKNGFAALRGHDYVSNQVIEPLVDRCIELGVEYLTLWAFSTENWGRDEQEVAGLMNLFRTAFQKNAEKLFQKGVRLQAIGNLTRFPMDIQQGVASFIKKTAVNDKITVTFALNYGGRDEILRAIKEICDEVTNTEDISEKALSAHLDTAGMPDPDLIIRPSGEQRLSGFLPWQTVYAELYFTDILMPDFTPFELDKAIAEFSRRQRRFGK